MVSTTQVASAPPSGHRRIAFRRRQFAPAEGWPSIFLLGIVLLATTWTIVLAKDAPDSLSLAALAIGGLLTGLLLAKAGGPDLLAHMLGILSGVLAALFLTVERLPLAQSGPMARATVLSERVQGWQVQLQTGQPLNDPVLLALLLGAAAWLISYTSAWVLFRRGWLSMALGLPTIVSLTNLGPTPEGGTLPLLVVVVASTLLAAQHAAYRRQAEWSRTRLPYPRRTAPRFLAGGTIIALLVGGIAWTLPFSARDNVLNASWELLQEPWSEVTDHWNGLVARWGGTGSQDGVAYSALGQSFRLGGRLDLSDDPVILLKPSAGVTRPLYLAGQRYDSYDGHGWTTTADDTFRAVDVDGRRFSSRLSFLAGQGVHLSPEVTTGRSQVEGSLTIIRPKGDLLFTIDTYLTANRRTNVALSWQQFTDQPFPLPVENPDDLPLELRTIGVLLSRGIFTPGPDSPSPQDTALAAAIEAEQSTLQQRLLKVRWMVSPQGQAQTLYVTGQIAVYDDVDAVFSQAQVAKGDSYSVTGLTSTATPDQLRAAGTDYPAWVTDRYLQLPSTITDRTRTLASELIAEQPTVFDAASTVERYVRSAITYREDIEVPPEDQDVVDYVLFDSQEGYCVYYASAMAVLLRAEGIPTRVVGGYYPAPYDADEGGILYREKNAHLWVEVFFPKFGWIPFEPTANRDTLEYGNMPIQSESWAQPTPEPSPESLAAEPTPTPVVPPGAENLPPDQPASSASETTRIVSWLGIMLATVLVMALLRATVAWFSGLRGLSPVSSLYARALRVGVLLGVRPAPSLTPHEYAARVGRAVPSASAPARAVVDLYVQEQYARQTPDHAQTQAAREAWSALRGIALGMWFRRNQRGE